MTEQQMKEDLSTLSDTVPLVTKSVTQAVEAAEALEQAAEALLQDVDEARQEVASHLNKVRDALPTLVVQIEIDTGRIGTAGDDASKAWDETHDAWGTAQDRLEKEAEEVLAARLELQGHLTEAGTKVDQSQAEGEAAVDALETEAQEAETKLAAAAQAVGEEVNELKQFMDIARSSLKDACATLAQRLLSLGEELEREAEQIIEDLKTKKEAQLDETKEQLGDLSGEARSEVEITGDRAQRTAVTPVTEAGDDLGVELERLSANTEKGEETLRREGLELAQALSQVETEAGRLPEGIRQIDETARTLGL